MRAEVVLTLHNEDTEYVVGITGLCSFDPKTLVLSIPSPLEEGAIMTLVDFLIIDFARENMHGLRLIEERPYTASVPVPPIEVASQHAELPV